jgi:protease-4
MQTRSWPPANLGTTTPAGLLALLLAVVSGCHPFPVDATGNIKTDSSFNGTFDVRIPAATDPGPMVPTIVRGSPMGPNGPRVALVDVDGLILNQNLTGLYSVGENPVSSFREKLEAAAADPRVRAMVIRIHSPGGGVAASDVLAEELRRFRRALGKPVVACLMDVATGGAYYLAVGCDRIIALPTGITGGIGAIVNHANLQDAMAQVNVRTETIKSGSLVDMGTVTEPLPDDVRLLFQQMADGFRDRFTTRVVQARPAMTEGDRRVVFDGRVIAAPQALALHMIDSLGYLDDAICDAERLAGIGGSEVVLFQRTGYPTHSIYSIVPNVPLQGDLIPLSYPGLDRSKLPTFLYLWQPDPTLTKLGGR